MISLQNMFTVNILKTFDFHDFCFCSFELDRWKCIFVMSQTIFVMHQISSISSRKILNKRRKRQLFISGKTFKKSLNELFYRVHVLRFQLQLHNHHYGAQRIRSKGRKLKRFSIILKTYPLFIFNVFISLYNILPYYIDRCNV